MSKNIENCIQQAFDKVDSCFVKDVELLEKYIQKDTLDNIFTEFTPGQESAIIRACQETYRACNVLMQAYVNTAIVEIIPQLKKEIASEVKSSLTTNDQ